ncbi:chemotaxis protein MotC [Rhizobium sp. GN54]|uniref:chemotaxis protein MotC n=1 Tax=Rhizobium sp. GN54 TaxID=2898150 RepID=UPI001E429EB4|nr:chemotaxis protein MotC [Rhizobium sp. GN54]MCD2183421.1 chemotaxis protein [Rhizobium sp. GN54]
MRPPRGLATFALVLAAGLGLAASAHAQDMEDLAPYKMIRSLQYVQDTVVMGDHSAMEMQRFMLSTIDERLRTADPAIFADPRNVDAALVYAMSGGNPQTLELLAKNDVSGHFDQRITEAVRNYVSGRGAASTRTVAEIFPEYRNLEIAPYLALVSANSVLRKDPRQALAYFDWARLIAPGTIVEEAALRRSIYVAEQNGMVDKGVAYASRYARRFLHSPYASQFADLFVRLAVENFEKIGEETIQEILSFMDAPRQREVYLRMARLSAISGKSRLAVVAAERAQALTGDGDEGPRTLADLYSGLASISSSDVTQAIEQLSAIPDEDLSAKDRALKEAARRIAEEVLRPPELAVGVQAAEPADLTIGQDAQAPAENVSEDERMSPTAVAVEPAMQEPEPATSAPQSPEEAANGAPQQTADPAFDGFVATGRSKLDEIDKLLEGEGS